MDGAGRARRSSRSRRPDRWSFFLMRVHRWLIDKRDRSAVNGNGVIIHSTLPEDAMRIRSWVVEQPGRPMVEREREESAGPGEARVRVAGCGGLSHRSRVLLTTACPRVTPFP